MQNLFIFMIFVLQFELNIELVKSGPLFVW